MSASRDTRHRQSLLGLHDNCIGVLHPEGPASGPSADVLGRTQLRIADDSSSAGLPTLTGDEGNIVETVEHFRAPDNIKMLDQSTTIDGTASSHSDGRPGDLGQSFSFGPAASFKPGHFSSRPAQRSALNFPFLASAERNNPPIQSPSCLLFSERPKRDGIEMSENLQLPNFSSNVLDSKVGSSTVFAISSDHLRAAELKAPKSPENRVSRPSKPPFDGMHVPFWPEKSRVERRAVWNSPDESRDLFDNPRDDPSSKSKDRSHRELNSFMTGNGKELSSPASSSPTVGDLELPSKLSRSSSRHRRHTKPSPHKASTRRASSRMSNISKKRTPAPGLRRFKEAEMENIQSMRVFWNEYMQGHMKRLEEADATVNSWEKLTEMLEAKLAESQTRESILEEELKQAKTKSQSTRNHNEALEAEIQLLQDQINPLQQKISDQSARINKMKEKFETYRERINDAVLEQQRMYKSSTDLCARVKEELITDREEWVKTTDELSGLLEAERRKFTELTSRVGREAIEAQVRELEQKTHIKALQEKIREQEHQYKIAQDRESELWRQTQEQNHRLLSAIENLEKQTISQQKWVEEETEKGNLHMNLNHSKMTDGLESIMKILQEAANQNENQGQNLQKDIENMKDDMLNRLRLGMDQFLLRYSATEVVTKQIEAKLQSNVERLETFGILDKEIQNVSSVVEERAGQTTIELNDIQKAIQRLEEHQQKADTMSASNTSELQKLIKDSGVSLQEAQSQLVTTSKQTSEKLETLVSLVGSTAKSTVVGLTTEQVERMRRELADAEQRIFNLTYKIKQAQPGDLPAMVQQWRDEKGELEKVLPRLQDLAVALPQVAELRNECSQMVQLSKSIQGRNHHYSEAFSRLKIPEETSTADEFWITDVAFENAESLADNDALDGLPRYRSQNPIERANSATREFTRKPVAAISEDVDRSSHRPRVIVRSPVEDGEDEEDDLNIGKAVCNPVLIKPTPRSILKKISPTDISSSFKIAPAFLPSAAKPNTGNRPLGLAPLTQQQPLHHEVVNSIRSSFINVKGGLPTIFDFNSNHSVVKHDSETPGSAKRKETLEPTTAFHRDKRQGHSETLMRTDTASDIPQSNDLSAIRARLKDLSSISGRGLVTGPGNFFGIAAGFDDGLKTSISARAKMSHAIGRTYSRRPTSTETS